MHVMKHLADSVPAATTERIHHCSTSN